MGILKTAFDRIKEWAEGKGRKKLVENCIIMVIIGIILIIAAGPLLGTGKKSSIEKVRERTEEIGTNGSSTQIAETLERKMEAILSNMHGAGKVEIMITFYSSEEIVPAYDLDKRSSNTEETDSEGGKRIVDESDYKSSIVYEDGIQGKQPVVLKKINPQIMGVIVVADGAKEAKVKEKLGRAVSVLLDIPRHKVQVFDRKK